MNLLRRWFGERRGTETSVPNERRGGPIKRSRVASDRLDKAVDDLAKTVSMSRADFCAMLQQEGDCPKLVENDVSRQVQFDTFAAICEFRYSPEKSLMRLCRNPEHEAHKSGVAACQCDLCPKMKAAAK